MSVQKRYVLDYYANKNLVINVPSTTKDRTIWSKIVYFLDNPNGKKLSIGVYIGDAVQGVDKQAFFSRILQEKEYTQFRDGDEKAKELFPVFKKSFKTYFPRAIPVTARYHIFSKQYYFYFYSEERFVFTEFLKFFRKKIGANFFLFQVWARDMIKMSPATDGIIGCNGKWLCCKSHRPLPSVNVEALVAQHLEGRDIERLKGRCGKLKCSLLYEIELYMSENKKYPEKWSTVKHNECSDCGVVTGFNIMNQSIVIRDRTGIVATIDLEEFQKSRHKAKSAAKKVVQRKRNLN